ncbi:MAG: NAD-dependent epimerase/dehydratase family protein [Nanoarchaeota archaeon]|nr:NAD-dependent epimerase/dehydratase family protein [Nanoarchaeota archaeon]
MKIIVTGGSGFVGSNTIKILKEKGYDILNYDLREGYDIRDFDQLSSVIEPGDKILHLAAVARFSEADQDPERAWTTNIEGTDCIAKAAKKMEAERIVYGSTGSVYMPIEENPPITESFKVRGNSVYGCTKLLGELAIKRVGIPYIILRYAHLYGEGKLDNGAINGFISRMKRGLAPVLYGGKQSGDFTYIKDIVQANILALESDKLNETYNIGSGEELTTEEVFNQLKEFFNYDKEFERLPLRAFDPNRFIYDISKARKLLNYNPQYGFKKGMDDWYKKHE